MSAEQNVMEVAAKNLIEDYVQQKDWRVNENANMAYSLQGLNNYIKEEVSKYYWMNYIYSPRVKQAHVDGRIHLHDSGSLSGYCMGLDLEDLLEVGFYGGPGKIRSGAPKHLRSALSQLNNLLFCITGCVAGAVAVSNLDTLMAPFIYYDNLNKDQVKQAIQEFIFNLNVPTRVGYQCLSEDTQILTKRGWEDYKTIKVGDLIATFNLEKQTIEYKEVKRLFQKPYKGKMINLKNRITDQLLTPNHRVVRKVFNKDAFEFVLASELTNFKTGVLVPVGSKGFVENTPEVKEADLLKAYFIGLLIAEGSVDRNGTGVGRITISQSPTKSPEVYQNIKNLIEHFKLEHTISEKKGIGCPCHSFRFNSDASRVIYSWFDSDKNKGIKFIPTWIKEAGKEVATAFIDGYVDGDGYRPSKNGRRITCVHKNILDDLAIVCVHAGIGTSVTSIKPHSPISKKMQYISRLFTNTETLVHKITEVDYDGVVWCPNTENETVIARRKDKVFITGNTPFSNCTLDFTVPKHMADKPVLVGGKRMDKTYKEFQKEMDLFNECFFEVMNAGDSEGRIFSFPIPTVNITKDFDWDNPRYDAMWQNTAKYGQPYFCNYVSSDMDPADAMSMCPLAEDTLVPTIKNNEVIVKRIRDIQVGEYVYDSQGLPSLVVGTTLHKDMMGIKATTSTGAVIEYGEEHLQPIYRDAKYMIVPAKEIRIGDQLVGYKLLGAEDNRNYCSIQRDNPVVMKLEHAGYLNNYYCITVDNDDHLFRLANGIITHNCRLRIDLTELKRKGGLFGANPLTGSVSVCTINFPRLGYLHKNDEAGFFKELDELLDIAKEALETRRAFVEDWTRKGLYPILKYYLRKTYARFGKYWTNHFSTFGTLGVNECLVNMFGYGIGDPRGKEFTLKLLHYLRAKAVEFQKETGNQYNVESIPGESTVYRLAKIDKKKYPDIIVADNDSVVKEGAAPFYTNSTQLPVNFTNDVFELLDNQSEINALYTGGSVQHLYLGERVKDLEAMKQLIKATFENYTIPYISITPTFSICPVHGYLSGEHKYCPQCKAEAIHEMDLEEERLKALLADDEQKSKGVLS